MGIFRIRRKATKSQRAHWDTVSDNLRGPTAGDGRLFLRNAEDNGWYVHTFAADHDAWPLKLHSSAAARSNATGQPWVTPLWMKTALEKIYLTLEVGYTSERNLGWSAALGSALVSIGSNGTSYQLTDASTYPQTTGPTPSTAVAFGAQDSNLEVPGFGYQAYGYQQTAYAPADIAGLAQAAEAFIASGSHPAQTYTNLHAGEANGTLIGGSIEFQLDVHMLTFGTTNPFPRPVRLFVYAHDTDDIPLVQLAGPGNRYLAVRGQHWDATTTHGRFVGLTELLYEQFNDPSVTYTPLSGTIATYGSLDELTDADPAVLRGFVEYYPPHTPDLDGQPRYLTAILRVKHLLHFGYSPGMTGNETPINRYLYL